MVNYISERDILRCWNNKWRMSIYGERTLKDLCPEWLFFELECFDVLGVYSISCIGCRMPFRPKL